VVLPTLNFEKKLWDRGLRFIAGVDDDEGFRVYQFGKHKGYSTNLHQEMIARFVISRIHRTSFIPEGLKMINNQIIK